MTFLPCTRLSRKGSALALEAQRMWERHRKYTLVPTVQLLQTGKCHFAGREISDSLCLRDAGRNRVRVKETENKKAVKYQKLCSDTFPFEDPKPSWVLQCKTWRAGSPERRDMCEQLVPETHPFSQGQCCLQYLQHSGNSMNEISSLVWAKKGNDQSPVTFQRKIQSSSLSLVNYLLHVSVRWKKNKC